MIQYKIELEYLGNWEDNEWKWSVYKEGKEKPVWTGITGYRWTARRAAKKAARKHAKGMRQPDPTDWQHEKFWYSV